MVAISINNKNKDKSEEWWVRRKKIREKREQVKRSEGELEERVNGSAFFFIALSKTQLPLFFVNTCLRPRNKLAQGRRPCTLPSQSQACRAGLPSGSASWAPDRDRSLCGNAFNIFFKPNFWLSLTLCED